MIKSAVIGFSIGTTIVLGYALIAPWLGKFFTWYWAWVAAL